MMLKFLIAGLMIVFSALTPGCAKKKLEKATLAGGCFWCLQPPFDKLKGVNKVTVGYTGGNEKRPVYEDYVQKGHREAIEITYDPLMITYPQLLEALQYLNGKFPYLQRIASYATPQDILRRSVDELKALRDQKLGILYVGVESGDDEVLSHVQKGATHDQMVEAARKVKEAGILLSVTVILGLGGVKGSEKHVAETARILTEMDPDFAGALTLTLIPGVAVPVVITSPASFSRPALHISSRVISFCTGDSFTTYIVRPYFRIRLSSGMSKNISPDTPEQGELPTPVWVWAIIGVGAVLALVTLVLLLRARR